MFKHHAHAAMFSGHVAGSGRQDIQPALNFTGNLSTTHDPRPTRRQLQRQRHPLDQLADMNDGRDIRISKRVASAVRAVTKKLHGAVVAQRLRGIMRRIGQAMHGEHPFLAQPQPFPRSHQTAHFGGVVEDFWQQISSIQHMLEIIQQQQQRFLTQVVDKLLLRVIAGVESKTDGIRNG